MPSRLCSFSGRENICLLRAHSIDIGLIDEVIESNPFTFLRLFFDLQLTSTARHATEVCRSRRAA